jgi:hypothetical protein
MNSQGEFSAGPPGVYSELGAFAHHLVDLLERGDVHEFPAVFEVVEQLLLDPDSTSRYVVQVGFLEDLGNIAANRHGWPFAAGFNQWFGPATANAWADLHRLWGTSDTG